VNHGDLNFHRTFPPEREPIGRLLLLADDMSFMTKEEIFSATGIPTGKSSGKVIPHIRYAEFMGLLQVERQRGKLRLRRTRVGEFVAAKDPYLTETVSQLLCHYHLTSSSGAPLWRFVVREYVRIHGPNVHRADVQRSSQTRFGINVNLSPFVSCYTRPTSFGSLGLLRVSSDKQTWSFCAHPYHGSLRYLYAYTLLSEWDQLDSNNPEITIHDVTQRLQWGAAFCWDSSEVLEVLSGLQDLGAIKLNRQLEPVTVIRTADTDMVLERLYTLLD